MFAGWRESAATIVAAHVRGQWTKQESHVIGFGWRCSAESAALINGVSAHTLDFDDLSPSANAHASAVVLPAVIALSERVNASGRAVIEAYLVGAEIVARLGSKLGYRHYERGWHTTSTVGPLGAAAAAAKVLGLDAARVSNALALAASLAGGTRQNFGTTAKPLHAGSAARAGVFAALLAEAGMTGDANILEGDLGFFALFAPEVARAEFEISLGAPWDILESGIATKRYPCCLATHRAIDAALELRSAGLDPSAIAEVKIASAPEALTPLLRRAPTTTVEAAFSLEYVVAAALLDGRVTRATFSEADFKRIQSSFARRAVRVEAGERLRSAGNPILDGPVEVSVTCLDGSSVSRRVSRQRGSPDRPLAASELNEKFHEAADDVIGEGAARRALESLWALPEAASVTPFIERLSPQRGDRDAT